MKGSFLRRMIFALSALTLAASVLFCFSCSSGGTGEPGQSGDDLTDADGSSADPSGDTGPGEETDAPSGTVEVKPDPPASGQEKIIYPGDLPADVFVSSDGTELPYRYYIPEDYSDEYAYPVLVYLHGAGECGTDNVSQLSAAVSFFIPKTLPTYQSIILIPQCPYDECWIGISDPRGIESISLDETPVTRGLQAVLELVGHINGKYSTNPGRQYITGVSNGGCAVWTVIERHPDMFTAAVPLCGIGDPEFASRLTGMPIRVYHGTADNVVTIEASRLMVRSIKEAGGENIDLVEVEGAGHNVTGAAYGDTGMWEWLFSQRKY